MNKFKGKKAVPKYGKRKANLGSQCRVLRSTKRRQTEDNSFELLGKVEMDASEEMGKNPGLNKRSENKKVDRQNKLISDFDETNSSDSKKALKCSEIKTDSEGMLPEKKKNVSYGMLNIDVKYEAFSDYFNITIPLIGKNVIKNNEMPFVKRYDLAVERNRKRFAYMKQSEFNNEMSRIKEREANVSQGDKKKIAMIKKRKDVNVAYYISKICSKILKELSRDEIRQKKIICYLRKVLLARVTSTCLLYVPHLVHTVSFIRGNKALSKVIRLTANECYEKFHSMFPLPSGYNFETVYTSEMRKFLPPDFEKFEDNPFDYGDIDDIRDNSIDDYKNLIQVLYGVKKWQ